jgi:hypothetical protein
MAITPAEAIVRYTRPPQDNLRACAIELNSYEWEMGELRCARSVCLPLVLSAARHCVRRHAGHVTERPRLGFPFARSAVAEVNYSYVQIGPAILRRHPITGGVQRGNSVTHSVAYATRNWRFDSGRPAGLNNLRRAAFKLSRAMTPRGLYKIAPSQQWPHSSEAAGPMRTPAGVGRSRYASYCR